MSHASETTESHQEAHPAWITRLDPLTDSVTVEASPACSLKGLTFAVKDNIDVQGIRTTAGCEAFAYTPNQHAEVVRKLLAAGASLKGKTNLDQLDRKSTRLNSSHMSESRMPSSA